MEEPRIPKRRAMDMEEPWKSHGYQSGGHGYGRVMEEPWKSHGYQSGGSWIWKSHGRATDTKAEGHGYGRAMEEPRIPKRRVMDMEEPWKSHGYQGHGYG